jgi:hypothetical protein
MKKPRDAFYTFFDDRDLRKVSPIECHDAISADKHTQSNPNKRIIKSKDIGKK